MFLKCIDATDSAGELVKDQIYIGYITNFTIPGKNDNGEFTQVEAVKISGINQIFYLRRFIKIIKINNKIEIL